jgi:hypothetical protein
MSVDAPVIIDAGPLMTLAKLNLLYLLKELYGRVHFARSVYDETVTEECRSDPSGLGDPKGLPASPFPSPSSHPSPRLTERSNR